MTDQNAEYGVDWEATFSVWPSLTIEIELAPWMWRFRWYKDDIEPSWRLDVGPLCVDFGANRGFFPIERGAHIDSSGA